MALYEYKRWSGGKKTVEADYVEFGNAHVTFWTMQGGEARLVLAERVEQVNELKDVTLE